MKINFLKTFWYFMSKKNLNQNAKYTQKFIDIIEPNFIFSHKPINRFKTVQKNKNKSSNNKIDELSKLREKLIQLIIVF